MSQPRNPRDAFLALADEVEREELQGLPGAYVYRLSVADYDALNKVTEDSTLHAFVLAVRDEAGEPLFSAADFPTFKKMGGVKFSKFSRQALAYNGMLQTAAGTAEKN